MKAGMDPETTEKIVQEWKNFSNALGKIEGVTILQKTCDVWDNIYNFQARDGDFVVASYPKSGTTWMQEIMDMILQEGDVEKSMRAPLFVRVPFLEFGRTSLVVANSMPSPRLLKSHLPIQLMPPSILEKNVRIVYVARNPKDCLVSYYFFHKMNSTMPDPGTWENFFSEFMAGEVSCGSWFDHVTGWWKSKDKHQILYVFYEDMIEDHRREIERVMRFMGKDLSEEALQKIQQLTSFNSMKTNPMVNFGVLSSAIYDKSGSSFFRKGIVGDWKNHFLVSQNIVFDEEYKKKMEGSGLSFRTQL